MQEPFLYDYKILGIKIGWFVKIGYNIVHIAYGHKIVRRGFIEFATVAQKGDF